MIEMSKENNIKLMYFKNQLGINETYRGWEVVLKGHRVEFETNEVSPIINDELLDLDNDTLTKFQKYSIVSKIFKDSMKEKYPNNIVVQKWISDDGEKYIVKYIVIKEEFNKKNFIKTYSELNDYIYSHPTFSELANLNYIGVSGSEYVSRIFRYYGEYLVSESREDMPFSFWLEIEFETHPFDEIEKLIKIYGWI